MAVGAMSAARELGFDVPADLTVVGFDDSEIARVVWPRLTTIRQPVMEMAKKATDMLLRELAGEDPGAMVVHAHAFIDRLTAAPPPASSSPQRPASIPSSAWHLDRLLGTLPGPFVSCQVEPPTAPA